MKDALVAPLISLSDPSPYSKQLNGSDERTPGFPNRSLASSTISAIVESNNMPCWMAAYTAPLCRWCSHRHNTIHWCSQRQSLYIDWCSCRHNNFISNTDVRHTTRASDRHSYIIYNITLRNENENKPSDIAMTHKSFVWLCQRLSRVYLKFTIRILNFRWTKVLSRA